MSATKAKNHHEEPTLQQRVVDELTGLRDSESVQQVKEQASELAKVAAKFVKNHPLESAAGAAVIGFILGAIVTRRN